VTISTQTRNTRQKDAIRAAFLNADRPLSPDEALSLAQRQVDALSIATVYRNISSLVEDRWLTAVEVPGDSTRYEVAGRLTITTSSAIRAESSMSLKGAT
jgi:Fur family ferric uptake transcriptional regulator